MQRRTQRGWDGSEARDVATRVDLGTDRCDEEECGVANGSGGGGGEGEGGEYGGRSQFRTYRKQGRMERAVPLIMPLSRGRFHFLNNIVHAKPVHATTYGP